MRFLPIKTIVRSCARSRLSPVFGDRDSDTRPRARGDSHVWPDDHRACGAIELSVAEELSQRAALALENGRLYNGRTGSAHGSGTRKSSEGWIPRHVKS